MGDIIGTFSVKKEIFAIKTFRCERFPSFDMRFDDDAMGGRYAHVIHELRKLLKGEEMNDASCYRVFDKQMRILFVRLANRRHLMLNVRYRQIQKINDEEQGTQRRLLM